jgi:hypothetical protein
VAVVHIGEHTLSRRLYEFSATPASTYTFEEFEQRVQAIENEEQAALEAAPPVEQPAGLLEGETGCEHLRELPGGKWAACLRAGTKHRVQRVAAAP